MVSPFTSVATFAAFLGQETHTIFLQLRLRRHKEMHEIRFSIRGALQLHAWWNELCDVSRRVHETHFESEFDA